MLQEALFFMTRNHALLAPLSSRPHLTLSPVDTNTKAKSRAARRFATHAWHKEGTRPFTFCARLGNVVERLFSSSRASVIWVF